MVCCRAFNLILALLSVLFSAIVLIGSSTDNGVVEQFSWLAADYGGSCNSQEGCGNLYIGAFNLVGTFENSVLEQQTSDLEYAVSSECPSTVDFCAGCSGSMKGVLTLNVFTLIFCIFGVILNNSRLIESGNTSRNKWLAVLASFIAVLLNLGAVALFGIQCAYRIIEYYIDMGVNYTAWTAGPSVILLVAVIIMKCGDGCGNMCTRVGKTSAFATTQFTAISSDTMNPTNSELYQSDDEL